MALLSRVYFNAVFGALGGLLGWMLFGVFGQKNPSSAVVVFFLKEEDLNMLLAGALIGGIIGYFVVSVEAIRDLSLVKFARLATYGACLGVLGGALGAYLGDMLNYLIVGAAGVGGAPNLILVMLARGLGWTLLGVAIGMSEGFAARSLGKFSYGTIGGALGGFVGGALYAFFYEPARRAAAGDTALWGAVGLIIMGACIGSLSAFVQAVFQPACVRVLRGWQEGREYPLDKPQNLLGRAEHADIALFRDMKVEKQHAYIRQTDGQYLLVNNNAPPEQTLVNERPVAGSITLNDGDRIQLGNIVLRFHRRAAMNRRRGGKVAPATTPSQPERS